MRPNPVFVVPRESSPVMSTVESAALALATRHDGEVHALEIGPRRGPSYLDAIDPAGRTAQAPPSDGGAPRLRVVPRDGERLAEIRAYAQATGAELIIVNEHHGSPSWWRSSRVVDRLARSAPVPVLVLPDEFRMSEEALAFQEVVAAIDFTVASAVVLRTMLGLTRRSGARVTLVHAVDTTPRHLVFSGGQAHDIIADARSETATAQERLEQAIPPDARVQVLAQAKSGAPERAIMEAASEMRADLVVMGAAPRGGIDAWLFGSTLRGVLRRSQTPVLVLPVADGAQAWRP